MQLGDRVRLTKSPEIELCFLEGRTGQVVGIYPAHEFDIEFRTQDGDEPLVVVRVTESHIERIYKDEV